MGLATGGVESGTVTPRYQGTGVDASLVGPRGSRLISSLGALSLMLDHGRRRQVEEVGGRNHPFFRKKGRNVVEFANLQKKLKDKMLSFFFSVWFWSN